MDRTQSCGTSGHSEEVQSSQGHRKCLEGFLQPMACFNLQVGKYELRPLHGELTLEVQKQKEEKPGDGLHLEGAGQRGRSAWIPD